MTTSFDLLIRAGRCMTPNGLTETDIGISGGKIVAFGSLTNARAAAVFDAAHLHVLPGVVDTQVHFREPGGEHKETLETGSLAAVLGGVTGVFEMPNTNPPTTSAEAIADKLARAEGRMHCNYAFYVGACPDNIESLPALEMLPGVAGVKAFMGSSTGTLLLDKDEAVLRALQCGRRRMAVHAEDEARLKDRKPLAEAGRPATHPVWRDEESARLATARVVAMAQKTGRRVHVLHVSTAEELPILAAAHDLVSVEVTPQHLVLSAPECYERLGALAQMNPPVRDKRAQTALWVAVQNGLVDVIGSDHAPHTLTEKSKSYPASPSGMPGVQTLVPLMLDRVNAGMLSLERFVDLTSAGAARLFGLCGKGRLALGYDADFTIVDLMRRERIDNAKMATKCGWTPFDGLRVQGWPIATVVGGRIVMRDGAILAAGTGLPYRFGETQCSVGNVE